MYDFLLRQVTLLILVSSTPSNLYRRRAIRDTWGSSQHLETLGARLAFLLGNPGDSVIQTQVTNMIFRLRIR